MPSYALSNKFCPEWPPFGLAQWPPFGLTKASCGVHISDRHTYNTALYGLARLIKSSMGLISAHGETNPWAQEAPIPAASRKIIPSHLQANNNSR